MSSTPLTLISSMATREVLAELVAAWQRGGGQAVTTEAAGGVDVARRVQGGEAVDVVVLSAAATGKLLDAGRLMAGSRVDLVRSGVALAVCAGAPRPPVDTPDAVRAAVLAAPSLSYSTGPSGVYLEQLFERWGILEQIRSRIVVPPPGVPVGSLVAGGRVQLGFQQLSELMHLPGIDVLGPLPDSIQMITVFSGGVGTACTQPAAARALLDFMASPAAADIKRRYGMEPA